MGVTNYLLTGMILQVDSHDDWFDGQTTCFGRGVKVWRFLKVGVLLGGGFIFSGQIIATSHDLTPNGGLVRESPPKWP